MSLLIHLMVMILLLLSGVVSGTTYQVVPLVMHKTVISNVEEFQIFSVNVPSNHEALIQTKTVKGTLLVS